MSKFLTPPMWYDKNGKLNEMLTGTAMPGEEGHPLTNLSIGQYSVAGDTDGTPSNFGTAVGYGAKASGSSTVLGAESSAKNGIAIGSLVKVTGGIGIGGDVTNGGIGIGGDVTNSGINKAGIGIGGNVTGNGIGIGGNVTGNGIGIGGDATANQIQLGNPNVVYDLKIGTGNGVVDGYIREGLYVPTSEEGFNAVTYDSDIYIQTPINGGIYIIRVQSPNRGTLCSFLFEFNAYNTTYSLPFNYYNAKDDTMQAFIKAKPHDNLGKAVLEVVDSVSNTANILHNFEISVRLISQKYGTG